MSDRITLDKTYTPQEVEARQYARWEAEALFPPTGDQALPPFSVMMPPPNVTGSLHMGHALNMTLQDLLTRYARMTGHAALWQPGTDHAGIATQMVVERQLAEKGTIRQDLGRSAFIERVWEWRRQSGGAIIGQLRRLGASADWSRERFTMDEGLSAAVRKVFITLYDEGLIYKDKRLVNWDPKLLTAISDLEVEQKEQDGHLWHFRYPVADAGGHIIVATTRPETMLGDTAVAVHPEDERYKDLVGKEVILPLVGRRIPIVADEYADPETGSGAVKITPAHDFNDFEVGRRHTLEMINILDERAYLNDNVPEAYRGLDRYEARKRIVADLEAEGLIEKIDPHRHTVPYGDRSGVVIEPWLTDQWYANAEKLAAPAIAAVREGKTRFVPAFWENTFFEWMENIQPWCISRQLWWGHRIPAWYGPDETVFVAADEAGARAKAAAHYGKEVALRQDEDVLDTWFSSALWPFSTLGWPDRTPELQRFYPSSVLVTGFDIIFFWVARMMMMGLHFMKDVPFRTVYIHALVRDAEGQKMSKSKGNVIDPLDLIDAYGSDALRFTLVSLAAQGRDVRISESRVEGGRNFATKLWNAARYCQMNDCFHKEEKGAAAFDPASVSHVVNRWIVGETIKMASKMREAVAAFRFNEMAGTIYHFTWGTFCDWYLEFTKPILAAGDPLAKETRATTAWVFDQVLLHLHPIMPFITEELWTALAPGRQSLIAAEVWPEDPGIREDTAASAEMGWLVAAITAIRSIRAEFNVAPGKDIAIGFRGLDKHQLASLETHEPLLRRLARVDAITPVLDDPSGAVPAMVEGAELHVFISDAIDRDDEISRITREIGKFDQEMVKIDKKLENPAFLAKAPEDVIKTQRQRREEAVAGKQKLENALNRLRDL